MFKKIISTIWEYFPVYMMVIVIACMYVYEQYQYKATQAIPAESCDTLITPQPNVIEYWYMKGPIWMDMEVICVGYEYVLLGKYNVCWERFNNTHK